MEDFLKSLGIDDKGQLFDNERYIVKTNSLKKFLDWYNKLSRNDEIEEDSESNCKASSINIIFNGEDYKIELYGIQDENDYTMTITYQK